MEKDNQSNGYKAVKRLAIERKEWIPIVNTVLEVYKNLQGIGNKDEVAGAWVFNRAKEQGLKFNNLRLLVSYAILQKEGTSRGGRRAYYSIIDPEGVERALRELEMRSKSWQ